ncbi:hypothetical protein Tco_0267471 [Tanacetum coccineum]
MEYVAATQIVASHGWSFASAVPGQMTHLVVNLTLNSANPFVVVGGVSSIFNLSFVIVDSFSCYWSSACPGVFVSIVNVDILLGGHLSKHIQDEYRYEMHKMIHSHITDPTDEDVDIGLGDSTGVLAPSGDEISLGGKKLQESDIDGGTIAGKAIITWDGGITSYACIYGNRSSCKVRNNVCPIDT